MGRATVCLRNFSYSYLVNSQLLIKLYQAAYQKRAAKTLSYYKYTQLIVMLHSKI